MKTCRRLLISLAVAVAGGVALQLCPGCQRGGEVAPIKIGAAAPLTGGQAEMGEDLINGIRMAVDEANAAGGILGREIELVAHDDKADPKEAVSVAHKLVADSRVVGIVGHMNSGTTLPASDIYHDAGVVLVVPDPTNPKITLRGFDNIFRVCITDAVQGPEGARYAVERLGKGRCAVLHDKTAYGQGLAEQFRDTAMSLEATVVFFGGITEGDRDFSAVLTQINTLRPQVLYFGGMYPEAGLILRQARQMGMDATFMTGDGSFAPEFIKIAGPASEGAIVSFLAPPWKETESAKEFVAKFASRYGDIKAFAPFGYDATNVLLEGIRRAGSAERRKIIDAIRASGFSWDGVLGHTEFDENGDTLNKTLYFYVVREGHFALHGSAAGGN